MHALGPKSTSVETDRSWSAGNVSSLDDAWCRLNGVSQEWRLISVVCGVVYDECCVLSAA